MTTRPFRELSAFECVLAVADRYDVDVHILSSRGLWAKPRATPGPMGHYANARGQRVYLESAVMDPRNVATELHEVVHCIVVPPRGSRLLEHHGLMQLETAIARAAFAHVHDQIEGVRDYQKITALAARVREGREVRRVGDWPHHERTRWWREGRAFMQRIGFIDARGRPTWRRGTWPPLDDTRAHAARCEALVR